MKFLKLFENYEECLKPEEVKPGMCGIVKIFFKEEKNSDVIETNYKVLFIFKVSEMLKINQEVLKFELMFRDRATNVPDWLEKKYQEIRKDPKYQDKYLVIVNQNVADAFDMMQFYIYGKDEFNNTEDHEFCVPVWNINNRKKLEPVRKIGVFESFNTLSPELVEYYNVVKVLTNVYKNLKIVNLTDSDDGKGIEFENIKTVSAEDNEQHAGENWEFTIAVYDDQVEIVCNNTGDNEEINSISDMIDYTIGRSIYDSKETWEKLIALNPAYKLECPVEILKYLGYDNLANAKKIGVFESLEDGIDVRMIPYYNVVKWCNYFQDLIVTIKNGNKTIIFNNDRKGRNEIGISKANLLYCQFGDHSDLIELTSLEQFVDFCGQDLASKDLFNLKSSDYSDWQEQRDAENELFETRRQAYILSIWSIVIQHDISYKVFCPIDVLNKLGFSKIANVKKIGIVDEN